MTGSDTIVALATGSLPSGVAVIRISGDACLEVVANCIGTPPKPRTLALRDIRNPLTGVVMDHGLVAVFPAPNSFTGEDCAELHLHGSPAVVEGMLKGLCGLDGVRLAEAGEFTLRAFEGGRLDLTEVEGLGDLLAAETENQRSLALARLSGRSSDHSSHWKQVLLACLVELEAQLDFSDEDDVALSGMKNVTARLLRLKDDLAVAVSGYEGGRIVREGFRVGLAGAPNAGKSSLFNYLAKSDLAIVTAEPGTTRDLKEVQIDLDGRLVTLIDSAGVRLALSEAEQEGVRRARDMLGSCDLVLWLHAPGIEDAVDYPQSSQLVMRIGTKSDVAVSEDCEHHISVKTGAGMETLASLIMERVDSQTDAGNPLLISRLRDLDAVKKCLELVNHALGSHQELELVCEDLRGAVRALERWIGIVDSELVLDRLFAGFCIGK